VGLLSFKADGFMAQLIVRQLEDKVVEKLREQAGKHGVSMEEEHRRILREALLDEPARRLSFKEALLTMPNVGDDKDFQRVPEVDRQIDP
jgi:plasmid stability protein